MKLIVGLGNPWKEYEKTRHNIWFVMLDRFIKTNKLGKFSFDKKYIAEILTTDINDILNHQRNQWNAISLDDWVITTTWDTVSTKKMKWLQLSKAVRYNRVIFCKPQTFMNRSWNAVAPLANFYKIETKDILVLHDEIDFITWRVVLKVWGSPAGHNWLKSMIATFGNSDFSRIRIGVDRPLDNKFMADWVLSTFKPEEKIILEEKYDEVEKLIFEFLKK